jgi:hypothetical protein
VPIVYVYIPSLSSLLLVTHRSKILVLPLVSTRTRLMWSCSGRLAAVRVAWSHGARLKRSLSSPLPEETEPHGADEGGLERSRSSPLPEETEPRGASGGGCERSRNSPLLEEMEPYEASGGGHERSCSLPPGDFNLWRSWDFTMPRDAPTPAI